MPGVGVFVTVTVPDDKKDEFLKVMDVDVKGSREEPGCLRFDLIEGEARARACACAWWTCARELPPLRHQGRGAHAHVHSL